MMLRPSILRLFPALAAVVLASPGAAGAQVFTRPWLEWRTLRTAHFDVHYPAEMEAWTRDMASRLDATWTAVGAMVGSTPPGRVTVVVEDPSVQANGSAFPLLDRPAISMWPTPPDPRSAIGHHRGFAEQLEVHEFAHIAHLTRASRNPRQRLLTRLLPVELGPVARRSPRWVTEGYATYVEGRVMGSGRPHSVVRAAVLREWALEGKLPTYAQMSSSAGFQGGSMAYLVGSAFLEWLAARSGEQSPVHLWRRMSARQDRTFAEAFAGVYGGTPQDLYGRFTVDLTEKALAARRLLSGAGLQAGTPVQRLNWTTGDPALSRDGTHLAIVLRGAPGTPSRVVVWNAREEPEDTAAVRARRRMLERDPEDVPAIQWRPRPRRALATLLPVAGRGHDEPRFLPDGKRILLTRLEPTAGGALRPDLFVWSWKEGGLRRVTRGASILSADPAPDGRTAVGVRCRGGICDLVRVDLEKGAVAVVAAGSTTRVFDRPRVSPDGRSVAAAVHQGGRWRIALVSLTDGGVRTVDPDDGASRYDAAFVDAGTLVVTSELGGVANLERLQVDGGARRPLTRVTGGAFAPEPDSARTGFYFLDLHSSGYDLSHLRADSAPAGPVAALPPALAPAAPPAPVAADTLARNALAGPFPYGLGPRRTSVLPTGAADADGATAGVVLGSTDPIGRLTVTGKGVMGSAAAERGAALGVSWRGTRPALGGTLAFARRLASPNVPEGDAVDGQVFGGAAWADQSFTLGPSSMRARLGAFAGGVRRERETAGRRLAFGEYGALVTRTRGGGYNTTSLSLHGSAGRTDGQGWTRGLAALALAAGRGGRALRGQATYGVVSGGAPAWERFSIGGTESLLLDPSLLSQRISMPGMPMGTRVGRRLLAVRGSATLGGLTPYYWAASTDADLAGWQRVMGAEVDTSLPSAALLGIPAVRLRAGAAYSLDAPWRHRARLYGSVVYRP
jgi:hypothetical protein